jgi:hypothetical protein
MVFTNWDLVGNNERQRSTTPRRVNDLPPLPTQTLNDEELARLARPRPQRAA